MNDKQILDKLKKEMKKSTESAQIPLRLQKESVIAMLKSAEQNETDFSVKTGTTKTKSNGVAVLRKMAAVAAMLAIVISGVLVMRSANGVKIIKSDSFYEGYKTAEPVKNAQSYADVQKAVSEILNEKSEAKDPQTVSDVNETAGNGVSDVQTTKNAADSFIKGYSAYVASVKKEIDSMSKFEPDGVAVYGDFKADIVKNDGEYLYIVSTVADAYTGDTVEQIKIVKADPNGAMENVSTVVLSEGAEIEECIEIYLKNNTLIAILNRYENAFAHASEISTVAVYYDISKPYAPLKIREHVQDGEYVYAKL